MKIEQIRRWTNKACIKEYGDSFQVKSINLQTKEVYCRCDNDIEISNYLKNIENDSELVTLDNIRESEWVECIEDCQSFFGPKYEKGKKYKVGVTADNRLGAINGNNNRKWHFLNGWESRFKPCLPPIQDKERTYSNAEIMHMMEGGKFIEGDKIESKHGVNIEISKTLSGEIGFCSLPNVIIFKKGDWWTIKWAEKWTECTVQEAINEVKSGKEIELVNVTGLSISDEKTLNDYLTVNNIMNGQWYKKVKRG